MSRDDGRPVPASATVPPVREGVLQSACNPCSDIVVPEPSAQSYREFYDLCVNGSRFQLQSLIINTPEKQAIGEVNL